VWEGLLRLRTLVESGEYQSYALSRPPLGP
jgi:hypothetical protein